MLAVVVRTFKGYASAASLDSDINVYLSRQSSKQDIAIQFSTVCVNNIVLASAMVILTEKEDAS